MSNNFKLAIISAFWSRLGGSEIGADLLRKNLKQRGTEIRIFTTQPPSLNDQDFIPINFRFPIPKEIILLGNFLLDKLFKRKIEANLKKYNFYPDIIHVQNIYALPGSVAVAKKLGIPLMVTIREPLPKVLQHPHNFLIKLIISQIFKSRNKVILKILREKCDGIVAVSDFIKNRLQMLGVPKDKIITIYNYPPKWELSPEFEKKLYHIKESKKNIIILYSGRLERTKGIHILIKSFREIIARTKNIRLIIAGEGPYEKSLKKLTAKLKMNEYITYTGKVPFKKMEKLYALSDVVCIPSTWPEPLSRVAFEAMSMGKPVISSRVGGMVEVIENGKTGLLVSPNNIEELASAIFKLIEDQLLRKSLGNEGKKFVMEKFDPKISIEKYIKLYKDLIKSRV